MANSDRFTDPCHIRRIVDCSFDDIVLPFNVEVADGEKAPTATSIDEFSEVFDGFSEVLSVREEATLEDL